MTSLPVRPLPPMIKTRLLESMFLGECPSSRKVMSLLWCALAILSAFSAFLFDDQEDDCREDFDAGVCEITPKIASLITISAMFKHQVWLCWSC